MDRGRPTRIAAARPLTGGVFVLRKILAAMLLSFVVAATGPGPGLGGQDVRHDEARFWAGRPRCESRVSASRSRTSTSKTSTSSGVRSTCNCTTPQIVKPDLSTFEVGEIVAEFNTRQFIGQKSAVVTVTFDKPRLRRGAIAGVRVSFVATSCCSREKSTSATSTSATPAERRVQITLCGSRGLEPDRRPHHRSQSAAAIGRHGPRSWARGL